MASIKTIAATVTAADKLAQHTIYQENQPFFASQVRFVNEKSNYACLFCDVVVTADCDVAITYQKSVRFAHKACIAATGGLISTDKKARKMAMDAAKLRRQASNKAASAQTAPATISVDVDALTAQIRAQVEAEYDEAISEAMDAIAKLQEALRLSQADYASMYEKATKLTQEKNDRQARQQARKAALVSK